MVKDEKTGVSKKVKREKLNFMEYSDKMHKLSLNKRNEIMRKRKNYCEEVLKTWKNK
jgi:hypothetical protein